MAKIVDAVSEKVGPFSRLCPVVVNALLIEERSVAGTEYKSPILPGRRVMLLEFLPVKLRT